MSNAILTQAEKEVLREQRDRTYWNSKYLFLQEHNGLRPGNLHLFLGTPGGGKSTLTRSLLMDCLLQRKSAKIVLWLSEESRLDFLDELDKAHFEYNLDNLYIYSELDDEGPSTNPGAVLGKMKMMCDDFEVDLLIIDNLTTSEMYMDQPLPTQKAVAIGIKRLANKLDIPIVILAHTRADINDNLPRLINMNDIRGSKTIVNLAQYLYIMQRYVIEGMIYPTISIAKHRGQDIKQMLFRLEYSRMIRSFKRDHKLSFADFKIAFKNRNVL